MGNSIKILGNFFSNKNLLIYLTLLITFLGLFGWYTNRLEFASISILYIPIAPSTALFFILISFSLILKINGYPFKWFKILIKAVLLFTIIICGIIIVHFLFKSIWDIEDIFLKNPNKFNKVVIGRMSPITAVLFILTSINIFLSEQRDKRKIRRILHSTAIVILISSFVFITGYIYKAPLLYALKVIPIALPTSVCFLLISITLIRYNGLPYKVSLKESIHFQLSKSFIPLVIIIMVIQNFIMITILDYSQNPTLYAALSLIIAVFISFLIINKNSSIIGKKISLKEQQLKEKNEEIEAQYEEYKQLNNELQKAKIIAEENEAYFKLLLENAPYAIFIQNDGKFTYVNKAAITLYQMNSYHEMIGTNIIDRIHPDYKDLVKQRIKNLNENKIKAVHSEYKHIRKDNSPVDVEVSAVPFNYKNNNGALVFVADITERKRIEEQLKQKTEEIEAQNEEYKQINEEYKQINEELYDSKIKAEESDKLKSSFLANMSHEIRTPMNGIMGFAELLDNPDLSIGKRKEYISIILKSSQQLLSIVNDILDISKIEAGLVTLNNERVIIDNLLSELQAFYNNHEKIKNIRLEKVTGISDIHKNITADSLKLMRILNNLLSNAFKFTKEGHIRFGYELKNNLLEFFVEDTGIGIPKDYRDKIFERFSQVETEYTRNFGGTGLGLAISKELVHMMGGEIRLESEIGKGTKVYFTIPYQPVFSEAEPVDEKKKIRYVKNRETKSVLLVDDDEVNLLFLKELVTDFNFNIFMAANGLEAVEMFRQNRNISLILMDIKMPVMNGIEATKLIKSIDNSVKIIAQTAFAMHTEKETVLKGGCDDYISKPLDKKTLVDIINKYL